MTNLEPYLAWVGARLNEARALPSDTLLLVIAGAVLLVLLLLNAWWKSVRAAPEL
jgi:hypothetical protein